MPADVLGRQQRRQITSEAVGIGVATGAYGLSFGAISVASGLDADNARALRARSDGAIVGTSLKQGPRVDPARALAVVHAWREG